MTEKQTTLTDNLGSYQTFSGDLSTYLAEILAAGGGTTDSGETTTALLSGAVALAATAVDSTTVGDGTSFCETPQMALAATGVPEPNVLLLLAGAMSILAWYRPPRGRPKN